MSKGVRIYPGTCTSAMCGRMTCPETCPHLGTLREFKAWRDQHAAKPADPIWSPLVYEARQ